MQNRLLAALPAAERARLEPYLEPVTMTLGQVLTDASDHVYFPVDCVIALLYGMRSGDAAEISLVGNEGVTGVAVSVGSLSTLDRAVVQSPGRAFRARADIVLDEFGHDDELQQMLFRYTRELLAQMAQTAACNWHHPPHQRLCRWILLTLDRVASDRLVLGRELVATILGMPLAEVDDAVAKLTRLGAINASPSQITVLNRSQIERLCCECYSLVKGEAERLARPVAHHKLRSII